MAQRYEFIRDEIEHYISALVELHDTTDPSGGQATKQISWKKHVEPSNCGGISVGEFSCGPNLRLQAMNW
jgi:hypothetical protein